MKKLKHRQLKEIVRFGEYLVSGNAQFWSGYIAFAVFDKVLGVTFWPAKSLSYFLGASVNFFLERFWVFGKKKISKRQIETTASRFYFLMFVNFIIDLAIVGGLRELGITPYIGQFVSAGFFTVWNYLIFKFWIFDRRKNLGRSSAQRTRTRSAAPAKRYALFKTPVPPALTKSARSVKP